MLKKVLKNEEIRQARYYFDEIIGKLPMIICLVKLIPSNLQDELELSFEVGFLFYVNCFPVHEFHHTIFRQFTTITRFFRATKRQSRIRLH